VRSHVSTLEQAENSLGKNLLKMLSNLSP